MAVSGHALGTPEAIIAHREVPLAVQDHMLKGTSTKGLKSLLLKGRHLSGCVTCYPYRLE